MRKSIFEIENRVNIETEFRKFLQCLYEEDSIIYKSRFMNLWEFLDEYVFNLWKYRDTFIDLESYLKCIGISKKMLLYAYEIDEFSFLNFLELMLNLKFVIDSSFAFNSICKSVRVKEIIDHNIPLILEKMNYTFVQKEDKIIITKRDSDVDSILEFVPENIQTLLLDYNDIRNSNIESKRTILKKIDLFIEERKSFYKQINSVTYDTIQIIVNNMGINHPVKEQKYVNMSDEELIIWYDKCFKLMIHLIRAEEISKINDERKMIVS